MCAKEGADMKLGMDVDVSGFINAIQKIGPTADDLLNMAGAGAAVVAMHQKMGVRKDTRATQNSIRSHIIKSTRTEVIDDIGPETEYAPYLEYGTGEFAEKGGRKGGWVYPYKDGFRFTLGMKPQPFVRPSAHGNKRRDCINAITTAFHHWILSKWPK
jgi:HK97 gp10 family phage protein